MLLLKDNNLPRIVKNENPGKELKNNEPVQIAGLADKFPWLHYPSTEEKRGYLSHQALQINKHCPRDLTFPT